MRVRLLGGLVVDGVAERELGSRKGRTLLKLLALARGVPVTSDRIADVLWGDEPPARPADQVGVLVSRLRGALGAERLPRTDAGYALVVDWLDIDELNARTAEATTALAEGRVAAARAAAEAALALARGPVLPADEGQWVESERATADAAIARAGAVAAEAALSAGDADGAAVAAAAALGRDPYDERALRALMRAHAAGGRPASALAAYAEMRTRLAEDLGVSPSAATESVHEAILLAEGDPISASVDATIGSTRPLVGRDAELEELGHHIAAARAGAVLVVIEGEPGIGKTALAVAAADEAGAAGAFVLRGRCDDLGRDLPLQPILDAVGPAAAAAGIALPTPDLAASAAVGDVAARRAVLFDQLADALARLARGRIAVIVLDDLHLAGESTIAWLTQSARRRQGLVLLATSRLPAPVLAGARRLRVGPLARDAAAALVGLDVLDERIERAAGNPLFLLALAAGGDQARGVVPASALDVASAQLDRLDDDAVATVRAAAVLGAVVDLDLLAEVTARPAVDVLGDLEAAMATGLLDEHGAGFAFHHSLVRESIETSVVAARRALLHREAARVLDERLTTDPLAVAVHAHLGGDTDRAVDAYLRAANVARARYDPAAALAHLDAAIALRPTPPALISRARLRMATLDYSAAAEDAAAAVALDPGPEAQEASAWIAYYQRRYDAAQAHADAAVDRAGTDAGLRASALAVAGRVRHGAGDLAGADERYAAAVGASPAVHGVVDVWLAHARAHQGRPLEALAATERALVDPERLAHPWAELHGRFARTMALGQLGRLAEATRAVGELDVVVARAGPVGLRFVGVAANLRGWLERMAGRWTAADDLHARAIEVTVGPSGFGPSSEAVAEPHYVALLDQAEVRLAAGDPEGAAAMTERLAAIDTWTGTMAWHQRHRLGLIRSQLALADGDRDAAAGHAAAVMVDASDRGGRRYALLAHARSALAGAETDLDRVESTIAGLRACAAFDSWRLADALGRLLGVDAWRTLATADAGRLVAGAGDRAEDVRALVASVLD